MRRSTSFAPRFVRSSCHTVIVGALLAVATDTSAVTRFVDASATGANNGTTWANAYTSLQSALTAAVSGDEIWVAAATYRPAGAGGPRTSTFLLKNGVGMYGGFPVGGGTFAQRDPDVHVTTLSGDLNSNDGPNFANNAENVYHVVSALNLTAVTVFDGFVVQAGNGNGNSANDETRGAGLYVFNNNDTGSLLVEACRFIANTCTIQGGGAYVRRQISTFDGCEFDGNSADAGGGGMFVSSTLPQLADCVFSNNTTLEKGGGLGMNALSAGGTIANCEFLDNTGRFGGGGIDCANPLFGNVTLTLRSCVFDGNQTLPNGFGLGDGAGVRLLDTALDLVNCRFVGNISSRTGGGAYLKPNSIARVVGCDFRGNSAAQIGGGGMSIDTSGTHQVHGCVFTGNSTTGNGGGFLVPVTSGPRSIIHCTFVGNSATGTGGGANVNGTGNIFRNCLFWANTDVSGSTQGAQLTSGGSQVIGYCSIQSWTGSLGGVANNGLDPQFLDANGPDNIYGTIDDDVRTASGSPAIDSANNAFVPFDELDADDDSNSAEVLPVDVAGIPRMQDDAATPDTGTGKAPIVDRGAHEFGVGLNILTYTGPSGGSWFTPGNWSGGAIPDGKTTVVIPGSVQISLPGALAADITVEDDGQITLFSTGTLTAVSVAIESGGTLTLSSATASLDVGSINVLAGGATQWTAGTIIVNGGGWTQGSAINVGCAGVATLDIRGGAAINVPAVQVCPLGVLAGRGSVSGNVTNNGILRPGDPTGQLSVGGTYLQTSSATLEMELGGYSLADYDSLIVTQQPTLGGTLTVTLRPAFTHFIGGVHTLVAGPNIAGAFATVNLPSMPAGVGIAYQSPTLSSRTLYTMVTSTGPRLFVNAGGATGGTAQSWATSVRSFQSALDIVAAFPGQVQEIWVAQGTYLPSKGPVNDDVLSTFLLPTAVATYGGFAGGETTLSQRDWIAHPTILTGDRNGDDTPNFGNRVDNCYTIVTAISSQQTNTTALDGFILRGGNALGLAPFGNQGGAMDVAVGMPAIRNCTFEDNQSLFDGGALLVQSGTHPDRSVMIVGCVFRNNRTFDGNGGGLAVSGTRPVIIDDCLFEDNLAQSGSTRGDGGGASIGSIEPSLLRRSQFVNNLSMGDNRGGGGAHVGNVHVVNCGFFGNHAKRRGGGLYVLASAATPIANCVVSGNTSGSRTDTGAGGGVYISGNPEQRLINCAVYGNHAEDTVGGVTRQTPGTTVLANTIVWQNSDETGVNETSQVSSTGIALTRCVVSGWTGALGGTGNMGSDPLLADPDGPDLDPGTVDDNLSLLAGSPAIDAGDSGLLPQDLADLDGDTFTTEPLPMDLLDMLRAFDEPTAPNTGGGASPIVDIGAYEFGAPTANPGLYVGPPGGSWFIAANWAGGSVPDSTMDVTINAHVVIAAASASARNVLIQSGGILHISTGSLTMQDAVVQTGGTLRMNDPSGLLVVRDLTLTPGSTLDWQSGTIHLLGVWTSTTTVNVGCSGASTLRLASTAEFEAPLLVLCAAGAVEGTGTVACDLTSSGHVRPGFSPGDLTIDGDYVQTSSGSLTIEVDDLFPAVHDRLIVTGDATLDGTLVVVPHASLALAIGEARFLTADSVSGTFSTYVPPSLPDSFEATLQVLPLAARLVFAPDSPRLYVKSGSPPAPGTSWAFATPDLALAVEAARLSGGSITEIWVAAGTYKPSQLSDPNAPFPLRTATFSLAADLSLYGGFAGTEATLAERDIEANPTILSGDLNGDDAPNFVNRDDNAYRVVTIDNATTGPVTLDGLIVRAGHLGWHATPGPQWGAESVGAGMLCQSPAVLRQCIFEDNFSGQIGAAIFCHGTTLTIESCTFRSNAVTPCVSCGFAGGAVVSVGPANLHVNDTLFENNSSPAGAALLSGYGAVAEIEDCTFTGNGTGALRSEDAELIVTDCDFITNQGSGIVLFSDFPDPDKPLFNTASTIVGCEFSGNTGPGVSSFGVIVGDDHIADCTFTNNAGSALAIQRTTGASPSGQILAIPTITNCTFSGNTAASQGGAVRLAGSSNIIVTFSGCAFTGNSAPRGGAVHSILGDISETTGMVFTNCTFLNNSASLEGGAIYNQSTSASLNGCSFTGNSAPTGSAIYNVFRGTIRGNPTFATGQTLVSTDGIRPGLLAPGSPVGVLTTSSELRFIHRGPDFGDTPALHVDVGGPIFGINSDGVDATNGSVVLTGQLHASLINGLQPQLGQTFEIIRSADVTGRFGVAYLPEMPPGLLMTTEYTSEGLQLAVDEIGAAITYADPDLLDIPGTPSGGALGDFDNDGDLDMVLCVPSATPPVAGNAYVLLNGGVDGEGQWNGFTAVSSPMAVGANPVGVTVGRFDNDAWLDFAVANMQGSSATMYRNAGTGAATFNAPVTLPLAGPPVSIGRGRFLVARDHLILPLSNNQVALLRFSPAGVLNLTINIPTLDPPSRVTAADLDNDGDDDLAVLRPGTLPGFSFVEVRLYDNGSSTFDPPSTYPAGHGGQSLIAGDLDGDTFDDLIVAAGADGAAMILINEGDGTAALQSAAAVPIGTSPTQLATIDAEPDDDVDLLAMVQSGGPVIRLARNDINGSQTVVFSEFSDMVVGESSALVLAGDVNNDNTDDVISVSAVAGLASGSGPALAVRLNTDPAPCPADIDPPGAGDGQVNINDLLAVINNWGPCPAPPVGCPLDISPPGGDGQVNINELLEVINNWGACP